MKKMLTDLRRKVEELLASKPEQEPEPVITAKAAAKNLDDATRRLFAPRLRGFGFTGSGSTFRRKRGHLIHVVNIQRSRWGSRFYLNLGAHLDFLPRVSLQTNYARIKEYECELRDRLVPADKTSEWRHNGTPASCDAAIADAAQVYEQHGEPKFARLGSYPEDFIKFDAEKPDEIRSAFKGTMGMSDVQMYRLFARVNLHEGRFKAAREFAAAGIPLCKQATGLRAELEQLVRDADAKLIASDNGY